MAISIASVAVVSLFGCFDVSGTVNDDRGPFTGASVRVIPQEPLDTQTPAKQLALTTDGGGAFHACIETSALSVLLEATAAGHVSARRLTILQNGVFPAMSLVLSPHLEIKQSSFSGSVVDLVIQNKSKASQAFDEIQLVGSLAPGGSCNAASETLIFKVDETLKWNVALKSFVGKVTVGASESPLQTRESRVEYSACHSAESRFRWSVVYPVVIEAASTAVVTIQIPDAISLAGAETATLRLSPKCNPCEEHLVATLLSNSNIQARSVTMHCSASISGE